jgi:deoxyribodipyrimidine photo-lyase
MLRIVWFKRDLRLVDHAPLAQAGASGDPVLPLWIVEPSLLAQPDASAGQLGFAIESAQALDAALAALGSRQKARKRSCSASDSSVPRKNGCQR